MSKSDGLRWWENPDRPCKDDDRYTEMRGVSKRDRLDMAQACASCPVYYECLDDLMKRPKTDRYGIQAGWIGLT